MLSKSFPRRRHLTWLAVSLALALALASFARAATLIDLGTLGGDFSTANDVNSAGQVVGYSYLADGTTERAFLWQSGVMTDLGTLPGYSLGSRANGINSAGQVVGTSSNGGSSVHAFLWQDGTMTDLGSLLGGSYNAANDINDAGQIVGEATLPGDTVLYGFLRQPDGTVINLGTLPGYAMSTASSINNAGQVVGDALTASFTGRAYLWQSGVMTDLGTLAGYTTGSYAYDINNAGQVVGYANNATGTMRAFLWQSGTGMINLGTLGGADSTAHGINDTGQIVGYSGIFGGPVNHAFFRSTDGTMTDLGVLAGYTSSAEAINNALQIVGASTSSAGPSHAFLTQVANCSESITVTTTADSGAGSLRQAMADVCTGGTITFASNLSGATIALSSTLPLDKPQTIDGSTLATHVAISGDSNNDGTGDVQVFSVDVNVTVTLKALTITKGQAMYGGGLRNQGVLTVTDSLFANNAATWGGGLDNAGTLIVTASTFANNTAAIGGGLNNESGGRVTLSDSTFLTNTATTSGGGLVNNQQLTMTNSVLSFNEAPWGGGLQNLGTLTVVDSTFANNTANNSGGGGGGLENQGGTLTVTNSRFFTNTAQWGGGLYNDPSGTVTVTDSVLTANTSSSQGGGLVNHGTLTVTHSWFERNTSAWGGGLANTGSLPTLTASTFVSNTATDSGGGLNNSGTLTATNATFSGNTATQRGGGVYNDTRVSGGALTLSHITLAGSTATSGGLYNAEFSTLHLINSLMADTTSGGECVNLGTLATNTGNLVEDNTCSPALSGDPQLAPLNVEGVHALWPTSPAIDAGEAAGCLPIDQRGQPRADLHCDSGAYELQYADSPTVIRSASSATATTFGPALVGLQRDAAFTNPGIITVTKEAWNRQGPESIGVVWNINPTVTSGFSLTLQLCYTDAELGSLTEGNLRFWSSDGTMWTANPTAPALSTINGYHCATLSGLDHLSRWTLATAEPTAVTVQAFTAQSGARLALPLLLIGVVTGSLILSRRQRLTQH